MKIWIVALSMILGAAEVCADERVLAFDTFYEPKQGEPLYKARCAACHDHPSGRTPAKDVIANNTPAYIFGALTDGVMRVNAEGLSRGERMSIAMYVSQNKQGGQVSRASSETPMCTHSPEPLTLTGSSWNGWGRTVENDRYQPNPGLNASDVPKLKLKWAMAQSGTRNGQPVIAGGRLFTNSTSSSVYSLDAKSGCAYWRFNTEGPTRSTIAIAPLGKAGSSRLAAFLTDAAGYLYAIDADNGSQLWRTKIDEQRSHQFTGSVTVFDGVVYAPVSSGEEAYADDDSYPCCRFRGALVAVSAEKGEIRWTTYTARTEPKVYRKNRLGNPMYGPAGGAIWSAPTIDSRRGVAYVATGDNYTDVPHEGSDAVIAIDLKSGAIVWINQLTPEDSYIIGCAGSREKQPANCPTKPGPDVDFGTSPTLVTARNGKQLILASQKSSEVYALDPDARGRLVWSKRLSPGGPLGGSEFGHAVDDRHIYIGISDVYVPKGAKPQLTALDIEDGELAWTQPFAPGACRWSNVFCNPGVSMAVTAIPGVVFAGRMDGLLGAYDTTNGNMLWSFDAAQNFATTLGGRADGGALDGAGPVVAGGMLYVHSGYWGRTGPGSVLLAFSVDGR